jgi:hypothetical protein
MNKKYTPDPITHAYDECREHFDDYICELQESLHFDSENPKDLLRFMSTFAGFCDSVDEAKNIVFEHFFMPYASAYFRHFKSASEEERGSQNSDEGYVPADGDLIDYVEAAESEEEFWDMLRKNSSNIYYLWSTSSAERKDHIHGLYNEAHRMLLELDELMHKCKQKDEASG